MLAGFTLNSTTLQFAFISRRVYGLSVFTHRWPADPARAALNIIGGEIKEISRDICGQAGYRPYPIG